MKASFRPADQTDLEYRTEMALESVQLGALEFTNDELADRMDDMAVELPENSSLETEEDRAVLVRVAKILRGVGKLPDEWSDRDLNSKGYSPDITAADCSNELKAILDRS
jgi:hypothetical protein